MEWEPRAHPPVIPSQLSAKLKVQQWAAARRQELMDGDGLSWQLHLTQSQRQASSSLKTLVWELTLQLKTETDASSLLATGILDPVADERLLILLGTQRVPFALRPLRVQAEQEDEAFKLAKQALSQYVLNIQKTSLKPIKRQLIGRFIDEQLQFKERA